MAGVCRLTLSFAVIIMEMSNEVHFLLPILVSVMVAKWVADTMTHSLYHCLLDVKCVPFLPNEPALPPSQMEVHAVEEVSKSVATYINKRLRKCRKRVCGGGARICRAISRIHK